jgi:hypothetical protein
VLSELIGSGANDQNGIVEDVVSEKAADLRRFLDAADLLPHFAPQLVMFVSIAGRVAQAFIGESVGVYRPTWTIEQINDQIESIRDKSTPWILPVVPSGHIDHIRRSFEMAAKG